MSENNPNSVQVLHRTLISKHISTNGGSQSSKHCYTIYKVHTDDVSRVVAVVVMAVAIVSAAVVLVLAAVATGGGGATAVTAVAAVVVVVKTTRAYVLCVCM